MCVGPFAYTFHICPLTAFFVMPSRDWGRNIWARDIQIINMGKVGIPDYVFFLTAPHLHSNADVAKTGILNSLRLWAMVFAFPFVLSLVLFFFFLLQIWSPISLGSIILGCLPRN